MHLTGSPQSPRFQPRPPGNGPRAPGLAFVAILVAALAVFVLVLPHSVVLPVFSLWALSAAACAALLAIFALRTGTSCAGAAWDMAGAFTLVGCAAAILGEIEPIIELIRPSGPRSKVND
jgi:multisubunit Na+/H+ antiporter MnhB subunit